MKRRILTFIAVTLSILLVVPIINGQRTPAGEPVRWRDRDFLFNMDFLLPHIAGLLYPLGISIAPRQVIIGQQGWLHLGDQYAQTVSDDRRLAEATDLEHARQIADASEAWASYLKNQGVKMFLILVGPNKSSIYPESLPAWAKPAEGNPTDSLFAAASRHHVDLRQALRTARHTQPEALYFSTDTHWNFLGAGAAFQAFAEHASRIDQTIVWPPANDYLLSRSLKHPGGDLANFLRMSDTLSDPVPMTIGVEKPLPTQQLDFDTREVRYQGPNGATDTQLRPLLVKSPQALNQRKVLWLRDSFGTALSPTMAATFSEVVQLHWSEALKPGGRLVQLVENWKPDYVFITVVERDARSEAFTRYPPPVVKAMPDTFRPTRTSRLVDVNAVDKTAPDTFRINGPDPYLDFALSAPVATADVRHLAITFECSDGLPSVPMQFFWLEAGRPYFDGERSVTFSLKPGKNLLDLHTLKAWRQAPSVTRVRLDIDAPDGCVNFRLSPPSLG